MNSTSKLEVINQVTSPLSITGAGAGVSWASAGMAVAASRATAAAATLALFMSIRVIYCVSLLIC